MLKFCCTHPPALELLLNAYDRIPPPDTWVEAVPPELWEVRGRGAAVTQRRRHGRHPPALTPLPPHPPQEHREFYTSAVRMAGQPRRLQHLARCALRRHLGARCHSAVPALSLPPALRRYVQLPLEGIIC